MVIELSPELEKAVADLASRQNVAPEILVQKVLEERFLPKNQAFVPRDEWEERLLRLAVNRGPALSDEALSSEGLYD